MSLDLTGILSIFITSLLREILTQKEAIPMKWAVEQCYFDNGRIRTRVRAAEDGEVACNEYRSRCDFYLDIFDSREEADQFAAEAKKA